MQAAQTVGIGLAASRCWSGRSASGRDRRVWCRQTQAWIAKRHGLGPEDRGDGQGFERQALAAITAAATKPH